MSQSTLKWLVPLRAARMDGGAVGGEIIINSLNNKGHL